MSTSEVRERPGRNLDYPFDRRPELGEAIEVVPGVHWIRMRLPMQLNHINLWLLEDGDGWTVVDSGIRNEETANAWKQLFAGPMGGRPVQRVIVTHMHPDHIGLAGWLVRKFDVELWITRTEFLMCRNLVADTGQEAPQEGVRFYRAAGWGDELIENYKARFGGFGHGVYKLPNSYRRIGEGNEIAIGGRTWRIVTGNGHSPEHACLWCPEAGLVISGDQLLPRISSNVSVHPTEPEANPLKDWLDSCEKLKTVSAVRRAGAAVAQRTVPRRASAARRTDRQTTRAGWRSSTTLCAEPKRAIDVFPALFRAKITHWRLRHGDRRERRASELPALPRPHRTRSR